MMAYAFGQFFYYWNLKLKVKQYLEEIKPDLVITVDSPAWNIHIIKVAKKLGIPTMQYVAPQLWAWASWRANKWRKNVDKLACILPFEPEWFAKKNISAKFVGHPLFDDRPQYLPPTTGNDGFDDDYKKQMTVALLPGSRKAEIEHLWQPMLQIADNLQKKFGDITFLSAASDEKNASILEKTNHLGIEVEICKQGLIEAITRADIGIIASGTATLEAAVAGCPMVVLYHVPGWQWHLIGKYLLTVKHVSLVNILANKNLVPEFVPFGNRIEQVTKTVSTLLIHPEKLEVISKELLEITRPISQNKASVNAANMAYEILGI
jgi:lipid-A-disaccharide synthase